MAKDEEKDLRNRMIDRLEYIVKRGSNAGGELWYAEIVSELLDELLEDLTENRI